MSATFDKNQTEPRAPGTVVTFDNPAAYTRTIRARALVFEDPVSKAVQDLLQRFSQSDVTVLIVGETGTGKELAARQLHRLSPRREQIFVPVNCAALPDNLVESELFGHERGAFTGAVSQSKGWFETANGGTLFLDEIGDLPLAAQVKILRALQEREINRVGGRAPVPIDIRLVAATNVNLEEAVRAGRFREDLYYRLNVAKLTLPPLRDRPGDILPLTEYFLNIYRGRIGLANAVLAPATREALLTYPWPGNIRELENAIHHALLVMRDQTIQPRDLNLTGYKLSAERYEKAPAITPQDTGDLSQALNAIFVRGGESIYADIDKAVIIAAFAYAKENQVQAAKLLGITRNVLRHRLKLYGLV